MNVNPAGVRQLPFAKRKQRRVVVVFVKEKSIIKCKTKVTNIKGKDFLYDF